MDKLNIKNVRLINPATGNAIVINDISIDLSEVQTKILTAMKKATFTNRNCFVLVLPVSDVERDLEIILNNRNILNTKTELRR